MAAGVDGLRRHLKLPEPVGKIITSLKSGLMLSFLVLHIGLYD